MEPVSRVARELPRYEGGALLLELHRPWRRRRELHTRMNRFAGGRLAVLATAPKIGAEDGTRTHDLYVGNVGSWPLNDFRMERDRRIELLSEGWKPSAPATIPIPLF